MSHPLHSFIDALLASFRQPAPVRPAITGRASGRPRAAGPRLACPDSIALRKARSRRRAPPASLC